ncbi:MAG: exosortase E/protease, VPEID-CTERM system [Planctomycetaceae bacterium]
MAAETTQRDAGQPPPATGIPRLACLGGLLAAEFAWLTLDSRARHQFGLLARPSEWAQVTIACAAALVLIGGPRLLVIGRSIVKQSRGHRHWWLPLVGHLIAFGTLLAVLLMGREWAATKGAATGFEALRVGLLLAAVALWIAALAPVGCWWRLMIVEWRSLLAGGAVGVAAWLAGRLTQSFWKPLSRLTFVVVEALLRPIYGSRLESDLAERIVGTPAFHVQIDPACAGYEGIGLVCVFLAAFFWFFRQRLRFPQAWLLWPVGISAIWLSNAVRITALVVLGASYSPAVAMRGFHSQAGWLFFNLVALGLMAAALRLQFFNKNAADRLSRQAVTPAAAYLVPLLTLVAMNMLAAAFSEGFDRFYPLKVLATAAVLWSFRATYRELAWSWSWKAAGTGVVVFVLWLALFRAGAENGTELHSAWSNLSPGWREGWLTFRVLGSVITVPLAEELAFRGYLLRRFIAIDFDRVGYESVPWWAVGLSSLLFGLMHGQWLGGIAAGLAYALVTRFRGRLCDAVVAHATTNALIAVAVVVGDAWWLW